MLTAFLYPCRRGTYTEGTMRAFAGCLVLVFAACGGGSTESGPKSADDASNAPDRAADEVSSDEGEARGDEKAESRAPAGPSCDDGTCSRCGGGICPAGWYCDEKTSACSWLTECADKPTCSCVGRVLGAGCKCREEAGGIKVACD